MSMTLRDVVFYSVIALLILQCYVYMRHTLSIGNKIPTTFLSQVSSLSILDILNHSVHDTFLERNLYLGPHAAKDNLNVKPTVAILVFVMDKTIPTWFDTVMYASKSSSRNCVFHWYFIAPYLPELPSSSNIHWVKISSHDLYLALITATQNQHAVFNNTAKSSKSSSMTRAVPQMRLSKAHAQTSNHSTPNLHDRDEVLEKLVANMEILIHTHPEYIVEFAPCLGTLFYADIESYSHWGFAEAAQLYGDVESLISADLLKEYDVFSTSIGDNFRLHLRRQFVLHKNNHFINNIWRSCSHFSQLTTRLSDYSATGQHAWAAFSPEWCYSKAVLDHSELKVYISSLMLDHSFSIFAQFPAETGQQQSGNSRKKLQRIKSGVINSQSSVPMLVPGALSASGDVLWVRGALLQCRQQRMNIHNIDKVFHRLEHGMVSVNTSTNSNNANIINLEKMNSNYVSNSEITRSTRSSRSGSNINMLRGRPVPPNVDTSNGINDRNGYSSHSRDAKVATKDYMCAPWVPKAYQVIIARVYVYVYVYICIHVYVCIHNRMLYEIRFRSVMTD